VTFIDETGNSCQPLDLVSLVRVNHGLTAVLGALGAAGEWDAIRREYAGSRGPATPLGERDHRFRCEAFDG
jgi:hypothetical protein